MLFQIQLGLENAAQNFMRMFLNAQRLEQQEKELDLREREFEQQMAELQARATLNQAQLQANPALQQDPAVQAVLGQIGNAQAPAGTAQALGPTINQAVLNQATQAAQGATETQRVPGFTVEGPFGTQTTEEPVEGEVPVEAPPIGQLSAAEQALGTPTTDRSARRQALAPTETEAAEQQVASLKRRLETFKYAAGLQLADRIARGETSLPELSESQDPAVLAGAAQLGIDTELRNMREDTRQELQAGRNFRRSLAKFRRNRAVEIVQDNNLTGEVKPSLVDKALRVGFDSLSEEEQTEIAPLRRQIERNKVLQDAQLVSTLENSPAQQLLSTFANAAREAGDTERAIQLFNQKRAVAEAMSGLPGDELPYPTLRPGDEVDAGFWGTIGNIFAPGQPFGTRQIEVDVGNVQGGGVVSEESDDGDVIELSPEDQRLMQNSISQAGGIQEALAAQRRAIREAGGLDEVDEQARRIFRALKFQADTLGER